MVTGTLNQVALRTNYQEQTNADDYIDDNDDGDDEDGIDSLLLTATYVQLQQMSILWTQFGLSFLLTHPQQHSSQQQHARSPQHTHIPTRPQHRHTQ